EMLLIRPAFIIEIMEKSGYAPEIFVGSVLARISADTSFHCEHVFAKTLRLSEFAKKIPGVVAIRHAMSPRKRSSLPQARAENRKSRVESRELREQIDFLCRGTASGLYERTGENRA